MLKMAVAGTTALFLCASPIANAQSSQTSSPASPERLNAADRNNLTDMRIDLVKAALHLTPEQEKLWPPVESAIRARAEDRKARENVLCDHYGNSQREFSIDSPLPGAELSFGLGNQGCKLVGLAEQN